MDFREFDVKFHLLIFILHGNVVRPVHRISAAITTRPTFHVARNGIIAILVLGRKREYCGE